MNNWLSDLKDLKRKYGFPLDNIQPFEIQLPNMTILDRKLFGFFRCSLEDIHVILITIDELNISRTKIILQRTRRLIREDWEIIFVFKQLKSNERREALSNSIPFVTLDGESFIPNLNIRLYPAPNADNELDTHLTLMGQRLFMFIVMDMLSFERKNRGITFLDNEYDATKVENRIYRFNGGSNFYITIGRRIGIRNRVSFNRAANDLIKHNLIKPIGETRKREYYVPLNSRFFFKSGQKYLQSPIKNMGTLFLSPVNSVLSSVDTPPIFSGNSALEKYTMISYDGPMVFAASSSEINIISSLFPTKSINSNRILNSITNEYVIFQKEKYDLKIFSKIFSSFTKYTSKIVDPLHLFLIFKDSNDERILGEIEQLLDEVWGY